MHNGNINKHYLRNWTYRNKLINVMSVLYTNRRAVFRYSVFVLVQAITVHVPFANHNVTDAYVQNCMPTVSQNNYNC